MTPAGALALMRPRQWTKNLLVAAAPLAAGTLTQPQVALQTIIAFVAMALASSATYCFNDARDAAADAVHPRKRARPIPSGAVSVGHAWTLGVVLAASALAVAIPGDLRWVVLAYLAVTAAYSLGLKHEPVLELAIVSMGFVLRAIAGGAASLTPISPWFLIVAGFGSLLMVTGKRLSELLSSEGSTATRRALSHYPASFLRLVLAVAAAVSITGYALWAAEGGPHGRPTLWTTVSVLPFVIAILRFALDSEKGAVEEPETVVLRDRVLQGLGALWLASYALGVYAG